MAERFIETEIRTSASLERVWQAWTEAARLEQWFPDRAKREGDKMILGFDRFGIEMPWEVLEEKQQSRVVYGGTAPDGRKGSVAIDVSRQGEETVIALKDGPHPDTAAGRQMAEGIESGWEMALGVLKLYVEKYFGEARTIFYASQETSFQYEQLLPYFLEDDKMAQWLTTSGDGVGMPGAPARMTLRDAGPLHGEVLAVTQREVAVSWDEIRGVLELKAFSMAPGSKTVAIRGCGWGLDAARAAEIEAAAQSALGRLKGVLACAPLGMGFF
jgi:uncharacterized protein YndB with AHSA1/START domain